MNLNFDSDIAERYHSGVQIARVLTENWVCQNMYCPRCGNSHIKHFQNNRPVADFFCPSCNNEYELKSKNGNLGHKINDDAYGTMIERITCNDNPDFIEKRKPLALNARRAGWTGCNILIDKIPEQGRISIITNGELVDFSIVVDKVNKSNQLETKDINSRSWLMDVLNYVNKISRPVFTLEEMYEFVKEFEVIANDDEEALKVAAVKRKVKRKNALPAMLILHNLYHCVILKQNIQFWCKGEYLWTKN